MAQLLQDASPAQYSPAQYCQAILVLLAAVTLSINVLPAGIQHYILDYGARETKARAADKLAKQDKEEKEESRPGALERFVATLSAHSQVPHAWFASFYALYLGLALGWAVQAWLWRPDDPSCCRYNLFGWLVTGQTQSDLPSPSSPPASAVALWQVYAASGLEALQSARRVYEHMAVFKPSKSTMNVVHWVLGLGFYLCMSVAVWIEGSQAITAAVQQQQQQQHIVPSPADSVSQAILGAKLVVGTSLFLFAWLEQYRCHVHLASLKKYSLPEAGLFRYFVCAHYTCECLLYLSLSILAAPEGHLFNRTLLASVIFVVSNLGVTAHRTTKWYTEKFGAARVTKKWKMVPFIF